MCDFSKINSRLEEFSRLKDGWNEGEGNPFDLLSLKKLSQCFSLNYPEYMPQPHIYPDLDDVIRFEWEFGKSHVDLDINILNLKSTIYSYNLETDEVTEEQSDLNKGTFWKVLEGVISNAMVKGNV